MEKEFIPYEEALALKELGFDGKCLGAFDKKYKLAITTSEYWDVSSLYRLNDYFGKNTYKCLAPLYQQAFRWLMIKCEQIYEKEISLKFWLDGSGSCKLMNLDDKLFDYDSEIECLKKLIEIVKNK